MVQWVKNQTVVAQVSPVAWIRSLAQEVPYAMGVAKKKKRKEKRENRRQVRVATEVHHEE